MLSQAHITSRINRKYLREGPGLISQRSICCDTGFWSSFTSCLPNDKATPRCLTGFCGKEEPASKARTKIGFSTGHGLRGSCCCLVVMLVMEKALKTLSRNEIAVESVESCRQLALVENCSGGMALPIMPR